VNRPRAEDGSIVPFSSGAGIMGTGGSIGVEAGGSGRLI